MTAPYYSDDLVTLYHGDNREITEWLDADAMVTDPPYGRGWRQGRLKDKRGGYKAESASRAGIIGDDSTAARDTALTMWGPDRPAILFGDLMLAPPAAARLVAVYAKPPDAGMRGAIGGVRRDLEAVYLCGTAWTSGLGGRSSLFRTMEAQQGSQHGIVARAGGHPHAKAQDVMRALIGLTPGGATIADPFAGSGSTLVAAAFLGRRAIGVELDEAFCEMAARRLSQGLLDLDSLTAGGAA